MMLHVKGQMMMMMMMMMMMTRMIRQKFRTVFKALDNLRTELQQYSWIADSYLRFPEFEYYFDLDK